MEIRVRFGEEGREGVMHSESARLEERAKLPTRTAESQRGRERLK